jgi:DNA polymerase-1
VADRHFENSKVAELSSTSSISYEDSATFGPQFSSRAENLFLAIDVETSAELESRAKVSPDALDPHKAELRILSAVTPAGNVVVHDFRKGPLPDYLRTAIATTPLLVHGAAFDLAVLEANGIKTSRDVFCTLTASRLLTVGLRDSNDLGAVVKRYLGLELPKELGASDWGGMFLTDQQIEYCRNDVIHLHRLCEALQVKLANPANEHGDGAEGVDLARVARLEMALIPLVVDIRLRGIKIDRSRLEQILKTYEAHKKQLAIELRGELQSPKLNFASAKQLLVALRAFGLEIEDTNKATLSAIVNPIAGRIVRQRQLVSLCTTMRGWLESLDADNRLYPPLNPLGTETGRFSCKNPNLLAAPRNSKIRGCIIADDGFVLIDPDFANIEMRIAAWFAQEPRMLEVFRNGGDIHGETAARVLGDRQARQPAKPVNFGCLYGGGAERLRITARTEFGIEFSPEQAKQYHEQFFATYANLRRWHEAARDASSELTYGATVYGRRRWADPEDRADHWDWNRFQLATNFEVQGTGADALKIALARLYQQIAGGPTRILLPIHDAILIQTPREAAESVAGPVSQAMREAFAETLGTDFPIAVDTNISERWGEKPPHAKPK